MSDAERPKHYLRQWREHSGKTLEAVAEHVGILGSEPRFMRDGVRPKRLTYATLGRIERGLLPYNQVLLEILAEIYFTDPASLLMRDPSDPEGIWSLWERLKGPERDVALAMLQGLAQRTGTGG